MIRRLGLRHVEADCWPRLISALDTIVVGIRASERIGFVSNNAA